MKKTLLFLMVSLFAVAAWADTSVTEKFTRVSQTGSSGSTGSSWTGDVCDWQTKYARRGTNDKLNGNQCTWITLNGSNIRGYIKTTNLEGGIKSVSFNYGQFGAEVTTVLKWQVSAIGATTISDIIERDGDLGGNTSTDGDSYSHTFSCKGNAQLEILNMSEMDNGNMPANGKARLLVNNITITPYLLYRNKDVTVGLKQRGYANNGSQDFINNTGSEGTISYSSSNEAVATVDENGVITPVAVGNAVITATWSEGASTTYTLHVIDGIVAENFSKVVQTGQTASAEWNGDLFKWEVANVRRGEADTLGLSPRVQATALRSNAGSTIISKNKVEGGVKHIAFDWRQWGAKGSATKMNIKFYYSEDKESWGDAVASQEVDAATASTPFVFNEDVAGGAKNAYLKMEYTADAAIVAVMGAMKITPWLLYTTKEATLDTRVNLTYTNAGLMNNTGATPTYEIAPENAAVSVNAAGQVAVEDGADVNADFTVTATWGAVSTWYTLHIVSRTATEASYPEPYIEEIGLNGAINKELDYTEGYDGTIAYASSNEKVAKYEAGAWVIKGVGQTTITATLPQTDNYKAAEASYFLRVIDNNDNVQVEAFSAVPQGNAAAHAGQPWNGDVYGWRVSSCGGVRKNGDKFASDQEREGIWMGTPDPNTNFSSLTVENGAEGGIKHIWFFCEQPYNTGETGYTLKPVVYLNSVEEANKVSEVEVVGTSGAANIAANRTLFGASNVTKSNSVLIIRNESYLTDGGARPAANRGRFLLDQIHITPYLLYTTKERTLDLRIATTCTYAPEINNTESGSITYSLEDNDEEASIDAATGEVTGIKAGQVTVKATWSEGASTTYTLNIIAITETEASYPQAEIHATMGQAIPANDLVYTTGYDGEISYASSVPAVADFENGVLTLKAPGQTKITATLPETSNYTAATASYMLTVSYSNYESFNPNGTTSTYAKPEENAQGDMCKWYVYIGGIQTPNYFSSNAITTRAQRTNESKQGYAKSAKLSGGISALAFNYSMMFAETDIENWDIHIYVNDRLVGQLTNEAGGDLDGINGRMLNPMRTKVITGIDEPGQFVIRFENHSTVKSNVEYESGNKGRFAIDNVSWENFEGAIALSESVDNSAVLAVNNGSVQDVSLTRSALIADRWNTLCLPFALDKSILGAGAEVLEMDNASLDELVLTIGFKALEGEVLAAGVPYLVKSAAGDNIVLSTTYNDVTVSSVASSVVRNEVTFQGIFSPVAMSAGDKTTMFVGLPNSNGDNLYYPSADGEIKGFRAYFKLNLSDPNQAPKRARFVVNQENTATGVENVQGDKVQSAKVLRNGQLFIIRGERTYSVDGQLVK